MLKGGGFQVIDLGVDVPAQKFVDKSRETGAQVLALSALLTTTMPQMKVVIDEMGKAGLRSTKVMVGGAPLTQQYADEIGANGYASDAASAVELAQSLI
jgi:5-methyltetrahydrofolate--homocysteine methyltransferase